MGSDEWIVGMTVTMEEIVSQHLIYDGILDLGEIPLPEDIISSDEVVELNTPPTPGLDYLAGSETSWWHDNYNNKNKKEIQEQHRHRQHHQQLYLDDSYNKNHEISDSDYNVADSSPI
ncbi:unnamed protein product [Trichobilharzia regenti]|nr:unnamed protein product [Trichobilharzia regenti]